MISSGAIEKAATGFAVVEDVLEHSQVTDLLNALESIQHRLDQTKGGIRNLLDLVPLVGQLACSPAIRNLVEPLLGESAFAVRGTLFDKTPEANWKVPWHQDLSIAVQEKVDVEGFGPWSVKAGVVHVQPPVSILESMLAVRVHLDDCGEDNGALRVIPSSHLRGRLNPSQIQAISSTSDSVACPVRSGGALLMRPLLLHASSASLSPKHRRVIHIDFASSPLPAELKWFAD